MGQFASLLILSQLGIDAQVHLVVCILRIGVLNSIRHHNASMLPQCSRKIIEQLREELSNCREFVFLESVLLLRHSGSDGQLSCAVFSTLSFLTPWVP